MKKIIILFALPCILSSCSLVDSASSFFDKITNVFKNTVSETTHVNTDSVDTNTVSVDTNTTSSNTNTNSSSNDISIDLDTTASVSNWSELAPYLEYALGDYGKFVPSFNAHKFNVSYLTDDSDTVAVAISCQDFTTYDPETAYSSTLNLNDFEIVNSEPMYGYKMVSNFDCLYIQYAPVESSFVMLAFYRTVRVAEWPTELANAVTGHKMPSLQADAYYYSYGINARNFISISIDCFFNDGSKSMSTWLSTLTKAGYTYTNQSGYYTATSADSEVIISFDDYYGDGTCIEMTAYSVWPFPDFANYFGFDLPRYNGENAGFETQFMNISGSYYVCVFYDGVDADALTRYGNQLSKTGFTLDEESSSETSKVYYLKGKTVNGNEEPWVQIAKQGSSIVIAVPYISEN